MRCTDCDFTCYYWSTMNVHYAIDHPKVVNPKKFFTKSAQQKSERVSE